MSKFWDTYSSLRSNKSYIGDDNGEFLCVKYKNDYGSWRTYKKKNKLDNSDLIWCDDDKYYVQNMLSNSIKPVYFREDRVVDNCIVGVALSTFCGIWMQVLSSKILWTWFIGLITDGYAMVLFSPFIIAYWILVTVLYLPFFVILSGLVIASLFWTVIFETPASIMNKDKITFWSHKSNTTAMSS